MRFSRFHLTGISCLLFALLSPAAMLGQSGRKVQPRPGDAPVVRVETVEVLIPVNAYDENGVNVTDLKPRDLLVVENGEPRTITDLRREPASIVIVLDLGNGIGTFKNGASSVYYERDDEAPPIERGGPVWAKRHDVVPRPASREFADNFVRGLGPEDRVAIIQYSDRVELIQDFTSNRDEALEALRAKYRIGLKSRYFDALTMAAEKVRNQPGRRVIVLLSDGIDTASKTSKRKALDSVARSSATVMVVGWEEVLRHEIAAAIRWRSAQEKPGSDLAKRVKELRGFLLELEVARFELAEMARDNGGELLSPRDFDHLVGTPRDILRELGAQYSLAFLTERGLESEHTINVFSARKGMSVRSRRTYYVQEH